MQTTETQPETFPQPPGVSEDVHAKSLEARQLYLATSEAASTLRARRVALGNALLELKPSVPHGLWAKHLELYGIHQRTAQMAMKLAKRLRDQVATPNQTRPPGLATAKGIESATVRQSTGADRQPNDRRNANHGSHLPPLGGPETGPSSLRATEIALGVRSGRGPAIKHPARPDPTDGLHAITVEELGVYEAGLAATKPRRGAREAKGQLMLSDLYEQARVRVQEVIDFVCESLAPEARDRMRELGVSFASAMRAILGGAT